MTTIGVTIDHPTASAGGPVAVPAVLAEALTPLGTVVAIPASGDLVTGRLTEPRPDIVFNGARGTGAPGDRERLAAALESLAIPFTGSGSATLALTASRPRTKEALGAHQVPTPAFSIVHDVADLEPLRRRRFPLALFRARDVYSARDGIVVESADDLEGEARRLWSLEDGPLLVERHLVGAVFCCVTLGNGRGRVVLPPVSVASSTSPTPRGLPAADHVPEGLMDGIERVVRATCDALDLLDLARVDVALSDTGVPHVVAVDPLPDLDRDGANPVQLAADAATMENGELIQRCLVLGAARAGVQLPQAPRLRDVRHRTPPRGLRRKPSA
jgi:D-alanine-D-alanine ligase